MFSTQLYVLLRTVSIFRCRTSYSPKTYTVILEIAGKEYTAQGFNAQHAKNLAASKALTELNQNSSSLEEFKKQQKSANSQAGGGQDVPAGDCAAVNSEEKDKEDSEKPNSDNSAPKSDISQVYELGQRLGLSVVFEEKYQENLAAGGCRSAKVFLVKCRVGEYPQIYTSLIS